MSDKSGFSNFEKQAMKDRAQELRREQANQRSKKNPEADVLEAIAAMPDEGAYLASKIHELVKEHAPQLQSKTWYGMPAYANSTGKVVLFFQEAEKYESRYCSLGFNDAANLDDGQMWPTSFALLSWNPDIESKIRQLIQKSVQ